MALPDKATKHISKPEAPIGTVKDGKRKVLDGDTGRVSWRQGLTGFSKDYDGDPTAETPNVKDMKPRPHHKIHTGRRQRPQHKPK